MTLNTYQIADELLNGNCARWSRAGALALAEYLEKLEENTGEEMELDTCAISCGFSEYYNLRDWLVEYYGEPFDVAIKSARVDLDGVEEIDGWIRSHIQKYGLLIEFDGGIIVSKF